jgi:hypothetical protein
VWCAPHTLGCCSVLGLRRWLRLVTGSMNLQLLLVLPHLFT